MINRTGGIFGRMTIAKRIIVLYGGFFSVTLLVISSVVISNASTINQRYVQDELFETVDNIEEYIMSGGDIESKNLDELLNNKYVEVQIKNLSTGRNFGSIVGDRPPFLAPVNGGFPGEQAAKDNYSARMGKTGEGVKLQTIQSVKPGQDFMLVESVITDGDKGYLIQAYKLISDNDTFLKDFVVKVFVIDAAGILISFLIGRYISKRMLEPVDNIRKTAERISIEDLSRRIEVPQPDDEIKELCITFNSMISGLEESFKKQSRFVSDASHELRTPVSVIQGYAKLISRWGKDNPLVLQESIESIIAETEHMRVLIQKLLFLAKCRQKNSAAEEYPISLNDTISEVVKELLVLWPDREISFDEDEKVVIKADFNLIKQLLWIYAENSAKHTKPGGKITFRAYRSEKWGCVSVEDDGSGIPPEKLPYIFDRFYRVDESRNREIPGTGLGLSIASSIVQSMNGRIDVKSTPGVSTVFTTCFYLHEEKTEA